MTLLACTSVSTSIGRTNAADPSYLLKLWSTSHEVRGLENRFILCRYKILCIALVYFSCCNKIP
jgi:hypothetical protein